MRGRGPVGRADEFIREVDEAVRQDRWLKLWKAYGTYIVGAVLAVVLATSVGVLWRNWQESQRLAEAARFAEAQELLRQDEPGRAADAFAQLAEDVDGGYGVLARLRVAEARAAAGDADAAAETLDRLAEDQGAAPVYRQLARILALQRDLASLERAEIEPLAAGAGPWRHSALELRALAEIEAGDLAAARATLQDLLGDPATPPNLSRRAAELLASIGGPAGEETATDQAGPEGGQGAPQ